MSNETQQVSWGGTVRHERWGTGRVLTIEVTGHRAQALIDFNGAYTWVVLNGAPMTTVHKRHEE